MIKFAARQLRKSVVLDLSGEFTIYEIPKIRDIVKILREKELKHFVFNLEKVEFIDSSGIGFLINVSKDLQKNGGTSGVVIVPGQVLEAVRMTRSENLLRLFSTPDSAAEAVEGLPT